MMTEKEYRELDALHSTALAKFNLSPDHALLPAEDKPYFVFGNAFEDYVRDQATGSNYFDERYLITPGSLNVTEDVLDVYRNDGDLDPLYVYTKKGELNRTHKSKHALLDFLKENPAGKNFKAILPESDFETIKEMSENFLEIRDFFGEPLRDVLKTAYWQYPVVWEKNGIKKKALYDCVIFGKIPGGGVKYYHLDIKSSANLRKFFYDYRDRGFIQDAHYTEGLKTVMEPKIEAGEVIVNDRMNFIVASKEEPYLAQTFECDEESFLEYNERYQKLCDDYVKWIEDGKPPMRWLPKQTLGRGYYKSWIESVIDAKRSEDLLIYINNEMEECYAD